MTRYFIIRVTLPGKKGYYLAPRSFACYIRPKFFWVKKSADISAVICLLPRSPPFIFPFVPLARV